MVAQTVAAGDIWQEFAEALRDAGYAANTVDSYLRHARVYVRRTGSSRISPVLIRQYLARRPDLTRHTQNCVHYSLAAFWLWQERGAVDRGHGGSLGRSGDRPPAPHPWVQVVPPPVADPLPALRAAVDRPDSPARMFAAARTLAFAELLRLTQATVGELLTLTLDDWTVVDGVAALIWQGAVLRLDDEAAAALRRWLPLLVARRKRPLERDSTIWGGYHDPQRCVVRATLWGAAHGDLLAVRRTYRPRVRR